MSTSARAHSKEIAKHKAIDMRPKGDHLTRERAAFEFFLSIPEIDRSKPVVDTVKGCQLSAAPVRILRRLCRLRRNPLLEIADAALRRPHSDCQRDRLFFDLWRKPSDDSLVPKL